jgi:NAD(P)-dependent dehydrogenase (short-subunit alcohol dehydrogenase family)
MIERKEHDWLNLHRRVCVITGAAGAIGTEIAYALSQAGAVVAALDRDQEGASALVKNIESRGGSAVAIHCDVTDPASVASAAIIVAEQYGRCQVLVNTAAVIRAEALLSMGLDSWNALLAVNLTGYFLCSQVFGKQMRDGTCGSIIHISSIAGQLPQPYAGVYSVSKAGVRMLSQQLALELGEFQVRSNVISPAMVRTPTTDAAMYDNAAVLRVREGIVPSRRIGQPKDIADAVLFLASDRSSYVNGHDLVVDGGLSQCLLGLIPRPGLEKSDTQSG